jgi:hypothetical protein
MKNDRLYDIEWTDTDGYHQDTGLTIGEAETRETELTDNGAADVRIIER